MPLLTKKAFALPPNASQKTKFKPPLVFKENIARLLNHKDPFLTSASSQDDSNLTAFARTISKNKLSVQKSRSVTTSFELTLETESDFPKRIKKPQIKEGHLQSANRRSNQATPEDMFNSSTTSPYQDVQLDSSLSQEVLNSKEMKEKYIEFWNENMTPEIMSDFQALSQEVTKAAKVEKKIPKVKKRPAPKKMTDEDTLRTTGSEIDVPKKTVLDKRISKKLVSKNATQLDQHKNPRNVTKKRQDTAIKDQATAKEKRAPKDIKSKKKIPKDDIGTTVPKTTTLQKNSSDEIELDLYTKMCLIHESRNVGLYVFCDACNKQRYLADTKDPLDLPEKWFCSMNPDVDHNKCDDEDVVIDEDDEAFMIYNLFNAGSVVWAKIDGYPWWPAMVEDDPDVEVYFWLEDGIVEPTYYHVAFFDTYEVTRAWIKTAYLKPFERNMTSSEFKVKKPNQYKSRIDASFKHAQDAIKMPLLDRLKKYSFIQRYKKPLKKRTIREKTTKKRPAPKDENRAKKGEKRAKKEIMMQLESSEEENNLKMPREGEKLKQKKRILQIESSEEDVQNPAINEILKNNLDLERVLNESLSFSYF